LKNESCTHYLDKTNYISGSKLGRGALCVDKRHKKKRKLKHNYTRSEPEFIRKFVSKKQKITCREIRREIQVIFAATSVGTDYFETMPSLALGSPPGLFAFTMSIAHPVPHSPISLTDTRANEDSSKARLFLENSRNKRGVCLSRSFARTHSLSVTISVFFFYTYNENHRIL